MNITVDIVGPDEHGAFQNLLKMYCYEWSQYNLFDVDKHGVFPFERCVHGFFEDPLCHCFLVRVDGVLAGLAIIDHDFALHKDYDYSMGEFFVMHKYRRLGVGGFTARTLFDKYPGKWEVGFHPANITSEKFWLRTVYEYTGGDYTLDRDCPGLSYHDGSRGSVLSFDNGKAQSTGV